MMMSTAATNQVNMAKNRRPRSRGEREEQAKSRVRLKVFKFGQHLQKNAAGSLVMLSIDADTDLNRIKANLARAAYTDSVDYSEIDWDHLFLLLMPDGEEITSPDMLCNNDRVVVLISETTFTGKLMSRKDVQAHMRGEVISPGGEVYGLDDDGGGDGGEVVYDEDEDDAASDIAREEDLDGMLGEDDFREGSFSAEGRDDDDRGSALSPGAGADETGGVREAGGEDGSGGFVKSMMRRASSRWQGRAGAGLAEAHGQGHGEQTASARRDGVVVIGIGSSPTATRKDNARPTSAASRAPRPGSAASTALRDGSGSGSGAAAGGARGGNNRRSRSPSPTTNNTNQGRRDKVDSKDSSASGASRSGSAAGRGRSEPQRPPSAVQRGSQPPLAAVLSTSHQQNSGAPSSVTALNLLQPSPLSPGAFSTTPATGGGLADQYSGGASTGNSRATTDIGGRSVLSSPTAATRIRKTHFKAPGVARMRKAVAKLTLIRRFNKNWDPDAYGAQTNTGSSNTMISSKESNSLGGKRRLFGRKQRNLGRTMDNYVKEQSNLYEYARQRKATNDQKLPWYILTPASSYKLCWDIVILFLVIWAAVRVPIRIGFDAQPGSNEVAFDFFSDSVFIIDLILNFFTTTMKDGIYITSMREIAFSYLKGWFLLDLLATFPVHWITDYAMYTEGGNASSIDRILRILKIFKLFRLLRLLKLLPKLFSVLETSVKIDPAIIRFLRSFVALVLMWHLMGCSYWFLILSEYGGYTMCPESTGAPPDTQCFINYCVCNYDPFDPITSLRNVTILPDSDSAFLAEAYDNFFIPGPQYAAVGLLLQYWYAFFYGVMVTTSIGNLDRPKTNSEYIFASATVLFGLMMYSMVIGSASSALANMDATGAARKKMLDSIIAYMRGRNVPRFFQKIIVDYYNFKWEQNKGDDTVMEMLPGALRAKLTMIINKDIIDRIPIFGYMSAEVYLRTVPHLAGATYLPGDYIIRQSEPGDHMYFIKSGKVDAVLPNGFTVFLTLFPGQFFGEKSLLYMKKRDASFRAVDFVDLLVMDRGTFTELYISAPEFVRELQKTDAHRDKSRLKFELSLSEKAKADEAALGDITDGSTDASVAGAATGGAASTLSAGHGSGDTKLNAVRPCCPTISWLPWCTPCCAKYKACQRAGFWGRLGRKMYIRLRACYRGVCGKAAKRFALCQADCCKKGSSSKSEDTHHYKWKREQIERVKSIRRLHKSGIKVKGYEDSEFDDEDDDNLSIGSMSVRSRKLDTDDGAATSARSGNGGDKDRKEKSVDLSKAEEGKPTVAVAGMGSPGGLPAQASFFSRLAFGSAKIAAAASSPMPANASSSPSSPGIGSPFTPNSSSVPATVAGGSEGSERTNVDSRGIDSNSGAACSSGNLIHHSSPSTTNPTANTSFKNRSGGAPRPILKGANSLGDALSGTRPPLSSLGSPATVNPAAVVVAQSHDGSPPTSTDAGAGSVEPSALSMLPEKAKHVSPPASHHHHHHHHHQPQPQPQPQAPQAIAADTAVSTGVNVTSPLSSARTSRGAHEAAAEGIGGADLKSRRSRMGAANSLLSSEAGLSARAPIDTIAVPPGIVPSGNTRRAVPPILASGAHTLGVLDTSVVGGSIPVVASARLKDLAAVPASARGNPPPPALPGAVLSSSRAPSARGASGFGTGRGAIGSVMAAASGLANAVGSTLLAVGSARKSKSAEQKEQEAEEEQGLLMGPLVTKNSASRSPSPPSAIAARAVPVVAEESKSAETSSLRRASVKGGQAAAAAASPVLRSPAPSIAAVRDAPTLREDSLSAVVASAGPSPTFTGIGQQRPLTASRSPSGSSPAAQVGAKERGSTFRSVGSSMLLGAGGHGHGNGSTSASAGRNAMAAAVAAAKEESSASRAMEAMLSDVGSPSASSPVSAAGSPVAGLRTESGQPSQPRPTSGPSHRAGFHAALSPVPEAHSVGPGGIRAAATSFQDGVGFGFRDQQASQTSKPAGGETGGASATTSTVFVGRALRTESSGRQKP